MNFTEEQLAAAETPQDLIDIAKAHQIPIEDILTKVRYKRELVRLQAELVKLQHWISKTRQRVAIIFEGRDAAGKGGSIKRFKEHLNPRSSRVVALNKPTDVEKGQWYFRRYIEVLPHPGEIVFFDRSWYNRAVVEPVMGFCTQQQYQKFMHQVTAFEDLLHEDNLKIIKFWFSITKEEQKRRFDSRKNNPLKRWKLSPVDQKGQELWDDYSHYIAEMLQNTHTSEMPWLIVNGNDKKKARLESMRYVLSQFDYPGKETATTSLVPDEEIVKAYQKSIEK